MLSTIKKQWFLPVFFGLSVLALFLIGSRLGSPTAVSTQMQAGSDSGILVVPVQIERDIYGIAMVDTVNQTIWIYQLSNRGPLYNRLKLTAARSWKYDKLLQQYNTAEPKPEQVKLLLENLEKQPIEEIEKQTDTNEPILEEKDSSSKK